MPPRTQWLFRLKYQGPDGNGTVRIVLLFENEKRFSLQISDRLGRSHWRIRTEGSQALTLNVREKSYCWHEERVVLEEIPMGELEFASLPALLADRLPFEPTWVDGRRVVPGTSIGGGRTRALDGNGRRWWFDVLEQRLESWALLELDGSHVVEWRRIDNLRRLVFPAEGVSLEYRESRPADLRRPLAPLEVPPGFQEICDPR